MKVKRLFGIILAGGAAGAVNGLFGAGGGMILVPLLVKFAGLREDQVFPCSVSIILPICVVSVCVNMKNTGIPIEEAWPYLIGSIAGGLLAGFIGHKIPTKYLHKILGILILYGGIRFIW